VAGKYPTLNLSVGYITGVVEGRMRPDQKDIFDCAMKQAEYAFHSFDARRAYEWKVTLGFWAVMALTGRFLYGKHLYMSWTLLLLGAALPVFIHGVWLNGIWKAHESDKRVAEEYRAIAVRAMSDDVMDQKFKIAPKVEKTPWKHFSQDWAFRVQISITALLSMALILIAKGFVR
jgi:hypothetical protein